MKSRLKIDIVSDIVCPWCVIGVKSLEQALGTLAPEVAADIHFHPFELNPTMPKEGQDIVEHIAMKYGATPEQSERNRDSIRQRGAALGFTFEMSKRSRIYNTFDAHRLLHWAETQGKQAELKMALFDAYFTQGRNPSDHSVLIDVAAGVGLDAGRAKSILESQEFAKEVRAEEQHYMSMGISAVPSMIINDRYLLQGGQPPEVFEQALRQIAAEAKTA